VTNHAFWQFTVSIFSTDMARWLGYCLVRHLIHHLVYISLTAYIWQ